MNWNTDDLKQLLRQIWTELDPTTGEAGHPWRLAALATAGKEGPAVRAVVVRGAAFHARRLICYSDARAPKIQSLAEAPQAEWMFYDPDAIVQVRAWGSSVVHHQDATTQSEWAKVPPNERAFYESPAAPGTVLNLATESRPAESEAQGWRNFAVILTEVEGLDWLWVRPSGPLRAEFLWTGNQYIGTWLTP